MFSKSRLFVFICFCFAFGCKYHDIDYGALDDDGDSPTNPWAMVDLMILASDDDAGEITLTLSEHLAQESNITGINLQFVANGSLAFTALDANNTATLTQESVLISMVKINFFNGVDKIVCPDNPIVADTLVRDGEDGVSFRAMDLACAGNKLVEMNAIAANVAELAAVASHAWLENHREVLKQADAFYEAEKAKGEKGALHKTEDEKINKHIDNFLIRHKMLKGYAAMHKELGRHHENLVEMKSEVKDNAKDSDKHIVIPATLNAFLDIRVNNRVIPDDNTGTAGGDTDLLLLKEAMGNAAAKFLQYDHLFQSDSEFASADMKDKYDSIKDKLPRAVQTHIDKIEDRFKQLQSDDGVYTTVISISNPLSARLTCMNTFLTEQKAAREACEDILGEFYNGLTSFSCSGRKADDADVFILLTTRKIMEATNLHDPCQDYALKLDKFNNKSASLISAAVKDVKYSVIKSMEDIQKNYSKNDFQAKLMQSHFYAAVPVVTEHPEKATELAAAVAAAHGDIYKKRKTDAFWQSLFGWIYKAAAVIGVLSLVLWLIPPAGAAVTGVASLLAAIAVGAGGFLAAGYATDYFHEKGDYAALEKAIYSGGQGDVAGLADTMMEWKEAKRMAIWEGIFIGVGVGGARRIITDPRAVRTAYTRVNIKDKLKSWKDGAKQWRANRQAAKAAANSDEAIEAAQRLKNEITNAKNNLKEAKNNLRNSKKALKQDPDNPGLKADVKNFEDKKRSANSIHKDLLAKSRQGIVARAKKSFVAGFSAAHNRVRGLKNLKPSQTMKDVKGFFANNIKKLKESRKHIYFLNRKAWKNSQTIENMNKFGKDIKAGGGKIRWRLNKKDGTAVFKADRKAMDYIQKTRKPGPGDAVQVDDFKLGQDGFWFAVLSADKLDRLLAWWGGTHDRGRRAIEGRIEGVRNLLP